MILDKIENKGLYLSINSRLAKAFNFIEGNDLNDLKPGRIDIDKDKIFVLVNHYNTKINELNVLEAHKEYLDLQYIYKGVESIEYELFNNNHLINKEYSKEEDYQLLEPINPVKLKLSEGEFAIFFPDDLHLPSIAHNNKVSEIKKLVIKILID